MRRVMLDVETKTVTVEGGVTCGDVATVAAPFGLAPVTAAVASVGLTGLTLGGGYGPLSPKYGLAIDNLLGAEIVLADGRLVRANTTENPELFWAVRGGGGNFGVVTSIRLRLHSVEKVVAGVIVFPESELEKALRSYAEMIMSTPDELATIPGLVTGADGAPSMAIATIWCGEETSGRKELGGWNA
jgi:FAD/FMN-containing dehydrogenase